MALEKTLSLTNSFGEQSTFNCYIRVVQVDVSKSQALARVAVMKDDRERLLEHRDVLFTPNLATGSANPWTQAYEHLKTLPEYAGATDC